MIMKKKVFVIAGIILLLVLLFPVRYEIKDGGSIQYKSLVYGVTKVHTLISDEEMIQEGKVKPYDDGWRIYILGIEVFDNVK